MFVVQTRRRGPEPNEALSGSAGWTGWAAARHGQEAQATSTWREELSRHRAGLSLLNHQNGANCRTRSRLLLANW